LSFVKKTKGMNRSRGEAGETIHHLYMAKLKGYITNRTYREFQDRYKECIRMLNGLEKTLERKVPEKDRRWQVAEEAQVYHANDEMYSRGWPVPTDSET
jgi:hypothetical protein